MELEQWWSSQQCVSIASMNDTCWTLHFPVNWCQAQDPPKACICWCSRCNNVMCLVTSMKFCSPWNFSKGPYGSYVDTSALLSSVQLLVTSNDSRIRLYNLKDHSLICKFKGCVNNSSQIKASFNHDAKFIICGSEDHAMYLWRTYNAGRLPSGRRDRNDFFECISGMFHPYTCTATFAEVYWTLIRVMW